MKNITIKEYVKLSLEEKMIYEPLACMVQQDKFAGIQFDIKKLTYNDVKGVMRTLPNFNEWKPTLDIYETCYKIEEDVFWQSLITDYFSTRGFIVEKFKALKKRENDLLRGPDIDVMLYENAGGKRLDPFSELLPLKQLGEIYGQYPLDLAKKPYNEIITLLVMHKTSQEVDKRYQELTKDLKL